MDKVTWLKKLNAGYNGFNICRDFYFNFFKRNISQFVLLHEVIHEILSPDAPLKCDKEGNMVLMVTDGDDMHKYCLHYFSFLQLLRDVIGFYNTATNMQMSPNQLKNLMKTKFRIAVKKQLNSEADIAKIYEDANKWLKGNLGDEYSLDLFEVEGKRIFSKKNLEVHQILQLQLTIKKQECRLEKDTSESDAKGRHSFFVDVAKELYQESPHKVCHIFEFSSAYYKHTKELKDEQNIIRAVVAGFVTKPAGKKRNRNPKSSAPKQSTVLDNESNAKDYKRDFHISKDSAYEDVRKAAKEVNGIPKHWYKHNKSTYNDNPTMKAIKEVREYLPGIDLSQDFDLGPYEKDQFVWENIRLISSSMKRRNYVPQELQINETEICETSWLKGFVKKLANIAKRVKHHQTVIDNTSTQTSNGNVQATYYLEESTGLVACYRSIVKTDEQDVGQSEELQTMYANENHEKLVMLHWIDKKLILLKMLMAPEAVINNYNRLEKYCGNFCGGLKIEKLRSPKKLKDQLLQILKTKRVSMRDVSTNLQHVAHHSDEMGPMQVAKGKDIRRAIFYYFRKVQRTAGLCTAENVTGRFMQGGNYSMTVKPDDPEAVTEKDCFKIMHFEITQQQLLTMKSAY